MRNFVLYFQLKMLKRNKIINFFRKKNKYIPLFQILIKYVPKYNKKSKCFENYFTSSYFKYQYMIECSEFFFQTFLFIRKSQTNVEISFPEYTNYNQLTIKNHS